MPRANRIGRRLSEFSGPDSPAFALLGRVARSGEAARTEMYIEELKKYFKVSAFPSNRGTVTAVLSDVTDRKRAQDELQVAEESLVAELAAMTRLHAIATRFVREGDLPALLEEVVDAAVSVVGADMASIQLRDPLSGELKLDRAARVRAAGLRRSLRQRSAGRGVLRSRGDARGRRRWPFRRRRSAAGPGRSWACSPPTAAGCTSCPATASSCSSCSPCSAPTRLSGRAGPRRPPP